MANKTDIDVSSEQKTLMLFHPHMTALAFGLTHKTAGSAKNSVIAKDPGMIACTDGNTVWYGKTYEGLKASEKNYIFLHELMHGIFRHVSRMKLIHLQKGFVFAVLTNYAADAIINTAIDDDTALKGITLYQMPKEFPGITMDTIHEIMAEAIAFTKQKPPSNYDKTARVGLQMEEVYEWLVWAKIAVDKKREEDKANQDGDGNPSNEEGAGKGSESGKGSGSSSEDSSSEEKGDSDEADAGQNGGGDKPEEEEDEKQGQGGESDEQDEVPSDETMIERIMRTEEAWDMEEAVDEIRKLLESGVTASELIERINGEVSDARGKVQAIIQGLKLQGVGSGNMLISLENDLPQAVVPWNRKLRRLVTRDLGTKMDDSYTRFGAGTRAAIAMRRPAPFQPGTTIFTERPRVLVVMDTSGSHVSSLMQCFAEVQAIARMKNAAIDVITFDYGVQDKIEIRNKQDFKKVLKAGVHGSGGTDLGNVFEEAKKMRTPYRAMVIMTDGYLNPPADTKGINIIWMVTPGGTTEGLKDSGEVIFLPDYTSAAEAA